MLTKRRLRLLVAVFFLSLGASGWYAYQWHQATHWTPALLHDSVRLNVTVGKPVNAGDGDAPGESSREKSAPGQVRGRLVQRLNREWRRARLDFFIAVVVCLLSGGLLIAHSRMKRQ